MRKSFLYSHTLLSVFLLLSFCLLCGFTAQSDIETAIMNKDFEKAKTLAESFIAENPASPQIAQVRYFLGISQLGLAHYQQARSEFENVLHSSPTDNLYDKASLGIIDSLGMEQNFEEDLRQSQQFLSKRPHSEFLSVIYLKLARANFKLSRWDKAQGYLKKIIRDFPKSFEAHSARQLLEEKRYFAIQVGSFLDQSRAMALADELKKKGEYAYLVETQDNEGRVFYRVRVGELKSLNEANRMQEHLSNQGYPTHIYP